MRSFTFPGGKRCAFTIIDDTDVATVENVKPVYRLLERLQIGATKTVWPVACPEGSKNYSSSSTLDDPEYRDFVLDLQRRGFEVASHGATMESSTRERTLAALEKFRKIFGAYPRVHANHGHNRENLYWGAERLDDPLLRFLYAHWHRLPPDYSLGHVPDSAYWCGDLAERHFSYVRNLTFDELNLVRINPSMPYHDPARPFVCWWFSATDAEDRVAFDKLLSDDNQDRLEGEGGICILATHFGKGFAQDGRVHPLTQQRFEALAKRSVWRPKVGELLDWLLAQRENDRLPAREWRRMQWRWAFDLVRRKWRRRAD